MLLVLEPLALIFLAIEEGVDTVALTAAFLVAALIGIAVSPYGTALALRLARLHLAIVLAIVFCRTRAERHFLSRNRCEGCCKYR